MTSARDLGLAIREQLDPELEAALEKAGLAKEAVREHARELVRAMSEATILRLAGADASLVEAAVRSSAASLAAMSAQRAQSIAEELLAGAIRLAAGAVIGRI